MELAICIFAGAAIGLTLWATGRWIIHRQPPHAITDDALLYTAGRWYRDQGILDTLETNDIARARARDDDHAL